MAGLIHLIELGSAPPSSSGSLGRDIFQFDIEPVDNSLLLRTIASDVGGLGVSSQVDPTLLSVSMRQVRVEPDKAPKRSVAFALLGQGTFIGCRRRQNALGEFRGAWPGLTSANLISFVRTETHAIERRKPNDQNENAKCCDNSFRRRCPAGVRSRHGLARVGKPPRFGGKTQPARSV